MAKNQVNVTIVGLAKVEVPEEFFDEIRQSSFVYTFNESSDSFGCSYDQFVDLQEEHISAELGDFIEAVINEVYSIDRKFDGDLHIFRAS